MSELSEWIIVILTGALVVVTTVYAWTTYLLVKSNRSLEIIQKDNLDLQRDVLDNDRKQYDLSTKCLDYDTYKFKQQMKPRVYAFIDFHKQMITFSNVGSHPAKEIEITCVGIKENNTTSDVGSWRIPSLLPDEIVQAFDVFEDAYSKYEYLDFKIIFTDMDGITEMQGTQRVILETVEKAKKSFIAEPRINVY
jgi:hypothetical protein